MTNTTNSLDILEDVLKYVNKKNLKNAQRRIEKGYTCIDGDKNKNTYLDEENITCLSLDLMLSNVQDEDLRFFTKDKFYDAPGSIVRDYKTGEAALRSAITESEYSSLIGSDYSNMLIGLSGEDITEKVRNAKTIQR